VQAVFGAFVRFGIIGLDARSRSLSLFKGNLASKCGLCPRSLSLSLLRFCRLLVYQSRFMYDRQRARTHIYIKVVSIPSDINLRFCADIDKDASFFMPPLDSPPSGGGRSRCSCGHISYMQRRTSPYLASQCPNPPHASSIFFPILFVSCVLCPMLRHLSHTLQIRLRTPTCYLTRC
jgi:hypothetical protein